MSEQALSLLKQERGKLIQEGQELSEKIGTIRRQITEAKRENAVTQEFKDQEWFNRAEMALFLSGKEKQKIQNKLIKVNEKIKELNIARDKEVSNMFKVVAREFLDSVTYIEICKEAERRTNEKEVQGE